MAGVAACSPGRDAPRDPEVYYSCADGQPLEIVRRGDLAVVKSGERIFNLQARRSSIGQRFSDGKTTLMMDGLSAVFVADDGADAISCRLNREGGL